MTSSFLTIRDYLMKPSLASFEAILRFIEQQPDDEERKLALEYTRAHLEQWPDRQRIIRKFVPEHPGWELGRHFKCNDATLREHFVIGAGKQTLSKKNMDFLKHVFQSDALSHFTHMTILRCGDFLKSGLLAQFLFTSESLTSLRHLSLIEITTPNNGKAPLEQAPWFPQLESLSLDSVYQNNFFATPLKSKVLEEIDFLGHSYSADSSFLRLLGKSELPSLQKLSISMNQITDSDFARFADKQTLTQLEELILSRNQLTDETARLLAEENPFPNLESLILDMNPITETGKQILLDSKHLEDVDIFL